MKCRRETIGRAGIVTGIDAAQQESHSRPALCGDCRAPLLHRVSSEDAQRAAGDQVTLAKDQEG